MWDYMKLICISLILIWLWGCNSNSPSQGPASQPTHVTVVATPTPTSTPTPVTPSCAPLESVWVTNTQPADMIMGSADPSQPTNTSAPRRYLLDLTAAHEGTDQFSFSAGQGRSCGFVVHVTPSSYQITHFNGCNVVDVENGSACGYCPYQTIQPSDNLLYEYALGCNTLTVTNMIHRVSINYTLRTN